MLVSCGCQLVVSKEVPLNSSSNEHDQEPLGGAIGAGAPAQGREVADTAEPTDGAAGGAAVARADVDVVVVVVVVGGNVVVVAGSGAAAGAGAAHVPARSFRAEHVPGFGAWGTDPHAPGTLAGLCLTMHLSDRTDRATSEVAICAGNGRAVEKGAPSIAVSTHSTSATPQSAPAVMRAPFRHFVFGSATILHPGWQIRTPIASDGNARRTENLSRIQRPPTEPTFELTWGLAGRPDVLRAPLGETPGEYGRHPGGAGTVC